MIYKHKNGISLTKMESWEVSILATCRAGSRFTQHQSLMLNERDQERFFDRSSQSTRDFYLIARTDDRLVGVVNVSDIDWISRCGDVGMMAKPEVRGGPESRKLPEVVTDFAFEFLNLHRVQAEVLDTNPAAMKFDLDVGYRIEGRRRSAIFKCNAYHDSVLIAMLRDEWAESARVKEKYQGVCNTQFRERKSFEKVVDKYSHNDEKAKDAAQQIADYKKTKPTKINDRRCDLIHKKYMGDGLDEAEEKELEECKKVFYDWMANSPWVKEQTKYLDEMSAKIDRLLAKVKAKK